MKIDLSLFWIKAQAKRVAEIQILILKDSQEMALTLVPMIITSPTTPGWIPVTPNSMRTFNKTSSPRIKSILKKKEDPWATTQKKVSSWSSKKTWSLLKTRSRSRPIKMYTDTNKIYWVRTITTPIWFQVSPQRWTIPLINQKTFCKIPSTWILAVTKI